MQRAFSLILFFALLISLCACTKTDTQSTQPMQSTDPTQSTTATDSAQPNPDFIIGAKVRDTFASWKNPAIFYGYNTQTQKEILIITDIPSHQDEYVTRIACLEVTFRGLEGFEYALNNSFTGKVLVYQQIDTPNAMYLHNAALTGTGTEPQYLENERIDLSNHGTNPSAVQYYLGYMFHNSTTAYSHEIWNKLSTGSSILLKGNMASDESIILQKSKQVYDRVLNEIGLGDILTLLEN